jgi:hypothetical protein
MVAFYKHDIPAWMDGTENLSDGAYRAYHVICQLIYLNEGPIALNERGIAGRCHQRLEDFRRYLKQLISSEKIVVDDGKVFNERCSAELSKIRENRGRGSLGGEASAAGRLGVASVSLASRLPVACQSPSSGLGVASVSLNDKSLKNNDADEKALERPAKHIREEKRREESTVAITFVPVAEAAAAAAAVAGLSTENEISESRRTFDRISLACHSALPADAAWPIKTSEDISPICAAISEGADLDADVVPAIKAAAQRALQAGRKIKTWNYFADAVRARAAMRQSASGLHVNGHKPSEADKRKAWFLMLDYEAKTGDWPDKKTPRSRVPAEVVERWRAERERHQRPP